MNGTPGDEPNPAGSPVPAVRWWGVALLGGMAMAGCYRTPAAPSLDWSQGEVEQLRHEIERMEWE